MRYAAVGVFGDIVGRLAVNRDGSAMVHGTVGDVLNRGKGDIRIFGTVTGGIVDLDATRPTEIMPGAVIGGVKRDRPAVVGLRRQVLREHDQRRGPRPLASSSTWSTVPSTSTPTRTCTGPPARLGASTASAGQPRARRRCASRRARSAPVITRSLRAPSAAVSGALATRASNTAAPPLR